MVFGREIQMANCITCVRIACSIALLFCPALSPAFYALYLIAGFSDMIDGVVARKTNTASEFGSKLDTLADFIFVTVCMIKILPVLELPGWIYMWIAGIALLKFVNAGLGFVRQRKLVAVHSVPNKVTGGMLFLLPLTLPVIDVKYTAAVVCAFATFAAVEEGYRISAAV